MSKDHLIKKYEIPSKHSNYQSLSSQQKTIFHEDNIVINSRYEAERLKFIVNNLDFTNLKVVDIGANTGFFTFELLNFGAKSIVAVEGNLEHSEFIDLSAKYLNESRVEVMNRYFNFHDEDNPTGDVALLLNVLHHAGDDYKANKISNIDNAKVEIIETLQFLSNKFKYMIFQLGFNWCGDITKPLFNNGTKEEMIDYISSGVENFFNISNIGVAERQEDKVVYNKLNSSNILRDDSLGEFLNRPIFIMESKKF